MSGVAAGFKLTAAEIKALVIDHKWMARLAARPGRPLRGQNDRRSTDPSMRSIGKKSTVNRPAFFENRPMSTALEARFAKTRALKQAMMQELLTGKTRLV
jgi:hypothetical protein